MKNLKINGNKIKAMIGTIILTTNLAACSFTTKEENNTDDNTYVAEDSLLNKEGLEYLLVDNTLVPISDVKLMDSEGNIVSSVDGIIVNNQIKKIKNPVEIMFSKDISGVVIKNNIYNVSDFTLVNAKTKEELKNIKGAFINNELVSLDVNNNTNNDVEHKILTEEEFYNLVDDIYTKLTDEGLPVTYEEVTKYVMIVNIDQLKEENKELVNTIIGDQDPNEVILDTYSVLSRIITENNNRWCAKGMGWDNLLMYLAQDAIFDEVEKAKSDDLGKRVRTIVETGRAGDNAKFNE